MSSTIVTTACQTAPGHRTVDVSPAVATRARGDRAPTPALYYLVARDTLIVWLIRSPQDVRVQPVAVSDSTLSRLVSDFRASLMVEVPDTALLQRTGERLLDVLVPASLRSALPDSGEIIVLPQGAIALVPFAALPMNGIQHPMSERYSFRYAASLEALSALARRPSRTRLHPVKGDLAGALIIGNPKMPTGATDESGNPITFSPLLYSEYEANWLGRFLGLPDSSVLYGGQATEDAVRRRIGRAPLVHFATHGVSYSSDERARGSFIALAPDSGRSDGLLTVAKIVDDSTFVLDADLVVLSACETALGSVKQAEGVIGLQRAFLAKGARATLVSLWDVSDQAKQILLQDFYSDWLTRGMTKSEALRAAQERMRKTANRSSPFFWAAFQLYGAD